MKSGFWLLLGLGGVALLHVMSMSMVGVMYESHVQPERGLMLALKPNTKTNGARQIRGVSSSYYGSNSGVLPALSSSTSSISSSHAAPSVLRVAGDHRATRLKAAIFGDGGAWQRQNPNEIPQEVDNPLDKLPEAPRSTVDANGMTWSYSRTTGADSSKPTIVFAHGILSSSYSFRDALKILQRDGYDAVAFDWPGFGETSKPAPGSSFSYSADDYTAALKAFLGEIGLNDKPVVLVTQGFILGQYGVLFASENQDMVDKLIILNTPLGRATKLPDPLGSYQGFLKGFAFGKKPDAGMFHAAGGPYAFNYTDYQTLQQPYEQSEDARIAFEAIMESLDWNSLLKVVDYSYENFRKPGLVAFGTDDRYLELDQALSWLETKPTTTKLFAFPATMGHFPQFDFPEQMIETITRFANGEDYTAASEVAGAGPESSGG
eukprot:CAMPEP_0197531854 /NCGR_PEP_ID=MMETSP1318-20131121/37446_1 /TAXON_ID=552666 /ORGANISM="Partenskyella glossopodia, Strain RCC365" /LENGTH=433 /DNA_ID=CAMNT_0043088213 /DNA_START=45 /DNA_END=1343 /DNA_ORIENTATION=+